MKRNGNYILHEFFADWTNLLAKGGTEHHNLFAVWCVSEDFLNISSHVCGKKQNKYITKKIIHN